MNYLRYLLLLLATTAYADTIEHFMNINNNIPQMEMKADSQSQAWARSARNVLMLTCESIAETWQLANEAAAKNGTPFFCLPAGVQLNAITLNHLIQQTYQELSSHANDKNRMTVSQIALLGLSQHYPCQTAKPSFPQSMKHEEAASVN